MNSIVNGEYLTLWTQFKPFIIDSAPQLKVQVVQVNELVNGRMLHIIPEQNV